MYRITKIIIYLLFFNTYFLFSFLVNGQESNPGEEITGQYKVSNHSRYQELVYIHTDRRIYLTGENVKFKVYCFERATSKPSRLSKVAYVEIYNYDKSTILRGRIELNHGVGFGEIYLPTSANSGNFVIRGYTRWMRNEGPGSFFHALLTIINPFKNPGLKAVPVDRGISLDFYPEGGSLIDQVPAKVVFFGKKPDGSEAGFSGKLMAEDSILICEFKPNKNGVGSFEFTPISQRNYEVEVLSDDGMVARQSFPPISVKGLSLRLIDMGPNYLVKIFCNDSSAVSPSENLYLNSYQKGMLISQKNFKMADQWFQYELDKKLLEEGVFSIQLLNSKGRILQTRKGFHYTRSLDKSAVRMNMDSYDNRDQVILELSLPESNPDTIDLGLSVSVSAYLDPFRGNYPSLAQYVILDNTLNLVPQVESYFNGSVVEVSDIINDLLIAKYQEQSEGSFPGIGEHIEYIPEFRGPLASGKIYNKINKDPGASIVGYLSIPGLSGRFYASKSGSDGDIIFELRNLYGQHEMIVQCDYLKDSLFNVELDDPYSDEYVDFDIPELDLNEGMRELLEQQSRNMQIENAYTKYKTEIPLNTFHDSSAFYGTPDKTYFLDDYTRFPVMEEVMREFITNVYVRKRNDGFHFKVYDSEFEMVYEDNPQILLDGLPVFDANEIMALDPLKIKKIETITGAYGIGPLDCYGIVSYTSYHGDLAGYSPHKSAIKVDYEGLQLQKHYAYPEYPTSSAKRSRIPDFRNSLYWSPATKWIAGKNPGISFYTSDDANTYEVRIEGITQSGKVISEKAIFEVHGDSFR